jgi:hypothetical protein
MDQDNKFDWKKMINTDLPRCSDFYKYNSKEGRWEEDNINYEQHRIKSLNTSLP